MVHGIPRHRCRSEFSSETDISCSWRNGYYCGIQQGTKWLPGNFHSPLVSDGPVQNLMGDLLTWRNRFKLMHSD